MPENPRRLHFGTDSQDPDRVVIYTEGGDPAARGYLELQFGVPTQRGQAASLAFVADWVREKPALLDERRAEAAGEPRLPDGDPDGPLDKLIAERLRGYRREREIRHADDQGEGSVVD